MRCRNSFGMMNMQKTDSNPSIINAPPADQVVLEAKKLNFFYGTNQALFEVDMPVKRHAITALIGPSGCGKSTLLRVFNRIYDLYPGQKAEGEISFEGHNLLNSSLDVTELRARIGMVFQKPTPFPMSIFDNIAFGLRLKGGKSREEIEAVVEASLKRAALWDEVKDKLNKSGLSLSGGQQQRLCVARGIAVEPEILLLDEPASALDPVSTAKLEDTLEELKKDFTIIIVTHNLQQAARLSDYTGFMYLGKMIEYGPTEDLFVKPKAEKTAEYIGGRFG